MNELSKNDQKSFVTQFIYRFDAVGAIILLLDFLYTSGETLDSLMREIPPSHIVNTSVSCSLQKQDEVIKDFFKKRSMSMFEYKEIPLDPDKFYGGFVPIEAFLDYVIVLMKAYK
jgi:phosphomannomutase